MESNKYLFDALNVSEKAEDWQKRNLIEETEGFLLKEKWATSAPYSMLKRLGIYVASIISILLGSGILYVLFYLVFSELNETAIKFISLLLCLSLIIVSHYLVVNRNIYRKGMDDATRHVAFWLLTLWFSVNDIPPIFINIIMFTMALLMIKFYADVLLTVVATILVNVIPLQIIATISPTLLLFSGVFTIPFNLLLISRLMKPATQTRYLPWLMCIKAYLYVAPIIMFISINPLALDTINNALFTGVSLPLPDLFLVCCGLLVGGLFFMGIKKHQVHLLHLGFMLFVVLAITFRQYHSLMPLSFSLLGGGLLFFILARLCISYLKKHPQSRFSFEPVPPNADWKNIEVIMQIEQLGTTSLKNMDTTDTTTHGGQFGGGGSDGNF